MILFDNELLNGILVLVLFLNWFINCFVIKNLLRVCIFLFLIKCSILCVSWIISSFIVCFFKQRLLYNRFCGKESSRICTKIIINPTRLDDVFLKTYKNFLTILNCANSWICFMQDKRYKLISQFFRIKSYPDLLLFNEVETIC